MTHRLNSPFIDPPQIGHPDQSGTGPYGHIDKATFDEHCTNHLNSVIPKELPTIAVLSFYDPLSNEWNKDWSNVIYVHCEQLPAMQQRDDNGEPYLKKLVKETFEKLHKAKLTFNTWILDELAEKEVRESSGTLIQRTVAFRLNYVEQDCLRYYRDTEGVLWRQPEFAKSAWKTNKCPGHFDLNKYFSITGKFVDNLFGARHQKKYGYAFPLIRGNEAYGLFFLYMPEQLSLKNTEKLALDLRPLFDMRFHQYFLVARQRFRDFARHSAAAAIMSRNVSHNLGSHILLKSDSSVIRAKLRSVYSVENQAGERREPFWGDTYAMAEDMRHELDRYMRKKWDFIAEVTSTPLYAQTPATFFKQAMMPFFGNTLLVDNIAGMENLGYAWRWRTGQDDPVGPRCSLRLTAEFVGDDRKAKSYRPSLRILDHDAVVSYDEVHAPYGLRDIRYPDYRLVPAGLHPDSPPDIDILLPGPLGEFALYGIIENIIRNAAKHNTKVIAERLPEFMKAGAPVLSVRVQISDEDHNPDYYLLRVSEELSDPDALHGNADEQKPLREALQEALNDDLIRKDGSYRQKNWGMAEIMICANLLAGKHGFKSSRTDDPPIVKVLSHNGFLTFQMHLLKPKRLAVIGKALWGNVSAEQTKRFAAEGIRFFEEMGDEVAGFSFILANKLPESGQIRASLVPLRRLIVDSSLNAPSLRDDGWLAIPGNPLAATLDNSPAALLVRVWRLWLNRWRLVNQLDPHTPIELSVFLGVEETEANSAWEKIAISSEDSFAYKAHIYNSPKEYENLRQDDCLPLRILYDRHGMLLDSLPTSHEEKFRESTSSYVMFDKLSSDFSRIVSPPTSPTFPYEIMEAGLLRILVIDGRLAERAMNAVEDADVIKVASTLVGSPEYLPTYWHIAKAARVMIATHMSFPGAEPEPLHYESYTRRREDSGSARERAKPKSGVKLPSCPALCIHCHSDSESPWTLSMDVTGEQGRNQLGNLDSGLVDLVLVHQGDVDKFPGGWHAQSQFVEAIAKHVPWVVVESGRGIPVEVQKGNARFLPFSVLEQWLRGDRVAKLCMADVLMNLTRHKPEVSYEW